MKEEEAESIAKEILKLDKNNEIALNVLNEVSKSKQEYREQKILSNKQKFDKIIFKIILSCVFYK